MPKHAARALLLWLTALTLARAAVADESSTVQLPYVLHDQAGSTWDVQQDGSIGDGGNDLYDGGGRLFINGAAQYQSPNQQATLDPARNELTFPPATLGDLTVSRRVAALSAIGAVRFTEILENPGPSPVKVQLRCYFNMGGSVQQAIPLIDDRRPRQQCGYAIGDQNNSVAMIAAGRGSKVAPRFSFRTNDDNVDIFYDVEVPARQSVAVVHLQLRRHAAPESADAWREVREKDLLKDLPRDLRRRVVNFPAGDEFVGDTEILRGDALDVVEVRGGDRYRGTLKVERFRLQTPYGPVLLPVDKVVSLVNVGTFKPSQFVITADGDVFGGRLEDDTVKLQLTGGQVTTIPLSQVTRVGYRKRPGEPDEWNFDNKTMAYLRGGARLRVKLPPGDVQIATPSGPMRFSPSMVAAIVFQGEDNNVPEVRLTDGTRLSALLGASAFDAVIVGLAGEQRLKLPASALLRFTFAPEPEPERLGPTMTLANKDQLVGTIGGTLSLETTFDTLHVEGSQVKFLTRARGAAEQEVQITLWDDSTLSGRLADPRITCQLKCGVAVRVPVSLIDQYDQPLPLPSQPVLDRIRQMARDLDADDWSARDHAQNQILALGPPAMGVLKQIQPTAPAEAAQRIDLIISRLTRRLEQSRSGGNAGIASPDIGGDANEGEVVRRIDVDR